MAEAKANAADAAETESQLSDKHKCVVSRNAILELPGSRGGISPGLCDALREYSRAFLRVSNREKLIIMFLYKNLRQGKKIHIKS